VVKRDHRTVMVPPMVGDGHAIIHRRISKPFMGILELDTRRLLSHGRGITGRRHFTWE
jgi:hypothetical protein